MFRVFTNSGTGVGQKPRRGWFLKPWLTAPTSPSPFFSLKNDLGKLWTRLESITDAPKPVFLQLTWNATKIVLVNRTILYFLLLLSLNS